MVVSVPEIINLILTPEPGFIAEAKEKHKLLNVHVNGRGVMEHLMKIDGHETEAQFELRKKTAMSNKFLFQNLLRPVDKVFSAKGGNKVYNLKGDKTKQDFKDKLNDVRYGMSLPKWLQMIQSNKFYSDPAGIVLFEISKDGKKTYPTIKSINQIRNYDTEGRTLEWVLFEPVKRKDDNGKQTDGEYFRFIDDAFDYTFHKNGDSVELVDDEKYPNPWKRVPAIVNSDVINDGLKYSDSPVEVVVELADKYLRTNTIKSIVEYLHGFPFFWMYARKCVKCNGSGEVDGDDCKSCKGTGVTLKKDVSDALLLNTPKDKDQPVIAPDVAGYVVPDLDIPKEQREELGWLWTMMHFTIWGTSYEESENPTATAAFLDVQPQNDRLALFSDAFEDMEQKITDLLGEFYYKDSYEGSTISYGRRYLIEPPDVVWKKYLESRSKGAPQATLNHLLLQYYQSEFMNDVQTLEVMIRGMKVEPFVHKSVDQIKGLVSQEEFKQKLYFSEWWADLADKDILGSTVDKLKKSLSKFASEKQTVQEQEPPTL